MPRIGMSEDQYNHVLNLTKALWRVTDLFSRDDGVLARQIREKASDIFSLMTEFGCSGQYEREQENIQAKIKSLIGFLEISYLMKCVKPINIDLLSKEYGDLQNFFEQDPEEKPEERIYPPHPSFAKEGSVKNSLLQSFDQQRNNKHAADQKKEKPGISPSDIGKIRRNRSPQKEGTGNGRSALSLQKERIQKIYPVYLQREKDGLNDRQKVIVAHMEEVPKAKVSDFYEMFNRISTKTVQRDLQDLVTKNILKKEGEKRWTMYSIVS